MSVREGEGERERPLGLNPPEGTRRQYEKSFNRNRSGEVCLKFKRQHGHDVRCWCSFFFFVLDGFFLLFWGRTRHRKSPKKDAKTPNEICSLSLSQLFIARKSFFFFFSNSVIRFCSHGLTRSPSLMEGGGVRGFAGGREGGKGGVVGARIAEPRTP